MPVIDDETRINVLHVDDEPDFADMAAEFIRRQDDSLVVETVTSASEALEMLRENRFDCIVSDYDMPKQNGIEFLEAVRKDYPELPFVLYTGKGSEEVASDAIHAGVTDYLQKGSGTSQYEVLANRILNVVDQSRSKRRAAELDRIRRLASDVNQALVRAESRDEIETSVCEIISDSDPYQFAWIGDVNHETDRIEPRRSAGIEDSYLDTITVTADESPTGQGPGGTAIRERRIAVSQNIAEDPEFEPWREEALKRGYRAVAAVPLEYEETLYGELVVYAERADAFDEDEQDLLVELGNDMAQAFHSFEVRDRLRAERDQRQALFGNAPTPVIAGKILGDDEHRISKVNSAFEDAFGYEAEEIVGEDVAEVLVPDHGADRHEEFRTQARAGEPTIAEVERITVDGPRDFLLTIIPFGKDDGVAEGWYAWYTDITERKEREQEIARLNQLHQTVLSNIRETVLLTDDDGQFTYICPNVHFVFGYEAEEVREFGTVESLFGERLIESDALGPAGELTNIETTITDSDGDEHTVLATVRQVEIEDGTRLYSVRDITERKEQQLELRQRNRQLEAVLGNVEAAVWIRYLDSRFELMNQNCRDLFGVADETDVAGKRPAELFSEEVAAQFREIDQQVIATEEPVEIREEVETERGVRTYLTRITPLFDDDDELVAMCGVASDIRAK